MSFIVRTRTSKLMLLIFPSCLEMMFTQFLAKSINPLEINPRRRIVVVFRVGGDLRMNHVQLGRLLIMSGRPVCFSDRPR